MVPEIQGCINSWEAPVQRRQLATTSVVRYDARQVVVWPGSWPGACDGRRCTPPATARGMHVAASTKLPAVPVLPLRNLLQGTMHFTILNICN